MAKTVAFTVRLPAPVNAALKASAKLNSRSKAAELEVLLKAALGLSKTQARHEAAVLPTPPRAGSWTSAGEARDG